MREKNWSCRPLKKKWIATTDSNHKFRIYPNLTKDLVVERLNQVWVADITYIHILVCFIYLAVILVMGSSLLLTLARPIGHSVDKFLEVPILQHLLFHSFYDAAYGTILFQMKLPLTQSINVSGPKTDGHFLRSSTPAISSSLSMATNLRYSFTRSFLFFVSIEKISGCIRHLYDACSAKYSHPVFVQGYDSGISLDSRQQPGYSTSPSFPQEARQIPDSHACYEMFFRPVFPSLSHGTRRQDTLF